MTLILKNRLKTRFVLFAILLSAISFAPAKAINIAQCDSMIKEGVNSMFKKEYTKALELLTEVKEIAEDNLWYNQLFLAKNNIGLTYFMMSEYGEALNYYQESYQLAIEKLKPTDEMIVLNNIAILYIKEKNYDKSIEYFQKAYTLAQENDSKVKLGYYGVNLGLANNEKGNLKEARDYLEKSITYLTEYPDIRNQGRIGIAENDFLSGNYVEAEKLCQELLDSASNEQSSILLLMARIKLEQGFWNEAISFARKALSIDKDLESKKAIYEILAKIYSSKQDFARTVLYKDSILALQDTLNQIKNAGLYQSSMVKFELQNYQHELELNKTRMNNERKVFYSVLALILVSIGVIFRVRTIKQKQQSQIEERSKKIVELELEKEKNENLLLEKQLKEKETLSLLEQARLKSEIESKNRELSAKALYLSGRNQLIEEIVASFSKDPEIVQNKAFMQQVKTLKAELKTGQEWDSFVQHFEQVNQGLLSKLKAEHPDLTANDIRFISYIYMNLLPKEIASMLNITPEAFRKRKERIAKKLELATDESLYDYLSTL